MLLATLSSTTSTPGANRQTQPPRAGAPTERDEPRRRWGFEGRSFEADLSPKPPVQPVSPDEQVKLFQLPPGYRLELVLSEPEIQAPGAIAFDGNGRMYVLELRSYMLDAEGTDTLAPISRISRHEDTNGDGTYDHHTVFVDHLIFPRFVTPFGPDSILTKNSNEDEIWRYTDTTGDGVADDKALFATGWGRAGNVEHQEGFLTWTMDNWLYSTVTAARLRWTPRGILREPTAPNRAQWGLTQDNDGKQWFQGGASGLPSSFQFPIVYGRFEVENQFEPDFEIPWGAPVRIADMQGGMNAVRMPDGSLNRVTAGSGADIYRGHRLPEDLVGDYLYGEPVARIVRRVRPVVTEGLTQLRNYYPNSEFIRSTDPLFRPVAMTTAPDGTVYIVDMYHGIIQESEWTPPGSYLRAKIEQYELDKVINHGRIWRLRYDGLEPDLTRPRMQDASAAELVSHLGHPNGWWRDTAQRLLVLKQETSVAPALQELTRTSKNLLARFHALWTLEGLGALDAALVREQMQDPNPRMRIQATRASETLYKAGDRSFAEDYRALTKDPSPDVVLQAMLTLNLLKIPETAEAIRIAMEHSQARGVQEIGKQLLSPPRARASFFGGRGLSRFTSEEEASLERGEKIYDEVCSVCHGDNGRGSRLEGAPPGTMMGPPLAASPRVQGHRELVVKTLLHGLTGSARETTTTEVMVPMGTNSDEWIADVGSYVRNAFGNTGNLITAADVARIRAATADRTSLWRLPELEASLPHLMPRQPTWEATASHNAAAAGDGLTFASWTTDAPQEDGMWFQLALPEPATITEIQFASPPQRRPRSEGGGQRPGRVRTPPPPPLATFPRAYRVQVSMDGTDWSEPVAEGQGHGQTTVIAFEPVRAKFIRVTQTGTVTDAAPWSIQNLKLYASP